MRSHSGAKAASILFFLAALAALLSGCDTTVPIYKTPENPPLYFSLYGQVSYSNGGTVRVERLRDSISLGSTTETPEVVTFMNLTSGKVDTLQISSSRADQLRVHNYRTPAPLSEGVSYRIEAEGPEGNVTSATLKIPEQQPSVDVLDTLRYCYSETRGERKAQPVHVRVDSTSHLGRVAIQYDTRRYGISDPYLWANAAESTDADSYRIRVNTNFDLLDIAARHSNSFVPPPPAIAKSATLTVVAVGPEWPGPEFNRVELEKRAVPQRYSNVKQGVGLVVGTRSVEMEIPVKEPNLEMLPSCP